MEQLIAFIERTGTVLVVTGALGLNSYWQPSDRLGGILGTRELSNVRREERMKSK
ncbi:hypothetical protein [Paenibacillus sp. BAC0078]